VALASGTRLGPYEIIAALGAGGMGEVYKARDTRLDRIVAIKILPEALSSDPEFRERFDREARSISRLEHPHICALHDVGERGGTAFLVMQYLEGETLADRLKRSTLPFEQALQCAIQTADALDTAHRAGIVHRDLKPGNIILTKAGAKLLDFGLAKTNKPVGSGAGLSMLPTTPPNLTAVGTILGTFQYMAPEQLEGREVDARTDIFAFGAVLYEMLTGNKAFEGRSQASLIASILTAEPQSLTNIRPLTPPALEHLVRVSLAKDPDRRWQSMRDVHRELTWIADVASRSDLVAAPSRRSRGRTIASALAIGICGMAAGAGLTVVRMSSRTPSSTPDPIARFSIPLKSGTVLTNSMSAVALSPDGKNVVFSADYGTGAQLYLRALDRLTVEPLDGTAGAVAPFFSPDGRWVGFWARARLHKIALGGGAPQEICDAPEAHPAAWSDDGTIFFTSTDGAGLSRVSANGGTAVIVTTPSRDTREKTHRGPEVLPGGKAVLMSVGTGDISSWDDARIEAVVLTTGERKILIRGGTNPRYVSSGHLIYARAGSLLAVPFDLDHLEVTGAPTTVVSDVVTDPVSGFANFAISRNGSLLYATGAPLTSNAALVWVDRRGRAESIGDSRRPFIFLQLSPDGQRVAVEISAANEDVWIYDLARNGMTRLTSGWDNAVPIWSPDGVHVAFQTNRATPGAYDLFWQRADGRGSAERLPIDTASLQWPETWSRDRRFLVFGRREAGAYNLWVWSAAERTAKRLFERSIAARISPDGRWIAYGSSQSGRMEVYVQAFPGPSRTWQVSIDGGNTPVWAPDGHELFYRSADQTMSARITTTPEFSAARPTRLFSGSYLTGLSSYDVGRDGRFLMIRPEPQTVTQLNVILNWSDELKSRAPRPVP